MKEAELGRIFYDEYPKATGRVSEFHRYLLTKSGKDDFNGLMQILSVLPGGRLPSEPILMWDICGLRSLLRTRKRSASQTGKSRAPNV